MLLITVGLLYIYVSLSIYIYVSPEALPVYSLGGDFCQCECVLLPRSLYDLRPPGGETTPTHTLLDSAAVLVHLKFILNIERQQRTSSSTVIINSGLFPPTAAGKRSYINFQLSVALYSLEGER